MGEYDPSEICVLTGTYILRKHLPVNINNGSTRKKEIYSKLTTKAPEQYH